MARHSRVYLQPHRVFSGTLLQRHASSHNPSFRPHARLMAGANKRERCRRNRPRKKGREHAPEPTEHIPADAAKQQPPQEHACSATPSCP